ncbi:MAG TPA: hypothetical protein VE954_14365 [Oligoflexus sp.]|nr:hypothetical protein [Oligoflexus sp.]HYX34283.1 hypothetical protein [Oligoflexus sp.]
MESTLRKYLVDSKGRFSLHGVRSDSRQIKRASEQIAKAARGRVTQQPAY